MISPRSSLVLRKAFSTIKAKQIKNIRSSTIKASKTNSTVSSLRKTTIFKISSTKKPNPFQALNTPMTTPQSQFIGIT